MQQSEGVPRIIGLDAKAAVPALIKALKDASEDVRYYATALGSIGPEARSVVSALSKALKGSR